MKAIVFDLDGTVLNTLDDIGTACNTALATFGLPVHPLKSYEQMVGNGFYVLLAKTTNGYQMFMIDMDDEQYYSCKTDP